MKAKIVKDWLGRKKDIIELHEDAKYWLSEIYFIKDEIRFLKHLMASNYIQLLDEIAQEGIKEYCQNLNERSDMANMIIKLIKDHEKILDNLIKTKSVKSNTHFLEQHKKIDKLMKRFYDKYKKLKHAIFKTVEEAMRKKQQKRIL